MAPKTARYLGLKHRVAEAKVVVLADGKKISTNKCVETEFIVEAQDTSGESQVLFCGKCGAQHLDQGEHRKKAHKNHQCEHCGHKFSTPKKTIGVNQPPAVDTKFEAVSFYILDISCQIILGMTFLCDFSIILNPREAHITVPSVEGTYLRIAADAMKKKAVLAEVS